MNDIIVQIRAELDRLAKDKKNVKGYKKFFKENIKSRGLASKIIDDISKGYFNNIKSLGKERILGLCEELLKSGENGEAKIAFDWTFRLKKDYTNEDFNLFYSWLSNYCDNWGKVDDFCCHAFGYFIFKFPEFINELNKWARSDNLWLRRASAVILIYSLRKKMFLNKAFEIAEILLLDKEDLVQKGYGWMLKEANKADESRVFDFIIKHKYEMPRTALRYSIEKFSKEKRLEAMN